MIPALWLTLGGCAEPGFEIPRRDDPLTLELRYPPDSLQLSRDSVALWGTVGTYRARLTVGGSPIPVEANGAFAALVPVPPGDPAVLELEARLGPEVERRTIHVLRGAGARPDDDDEPRPWDRWVRLRRLPDPALDSATQARPIYTRWSPRGPTGLAIDQGIRLHSDLRSDDALRLRVGGDLYVWVPAVDADTTVAGRNGAVALTDARVEVGPQGFALSVAAAERLPTHVEAHPEGLVWTVFDGTPAGLVWSVPPGPFLKGVSVEEVAPGRTQISVELPERPLGWRVVWQEGRLALQARPRPPAEAGLAGLVIGLDPGHPPTGTVGAAGLREDSMTLAVARVAADLLEARGARPFLIRRDTLPISLDERIAIADRADVDLFVSIHGNSPGPGRPPYAVDGTTVYWLNGNASRLGRTLLESVSESLGQRAIGVLREDLAVIRPTWYPAVLVEGMGLVVPEREAYLRTPEGVAAYARGLVTGLERWVARAGPDEGRGG